MQTLTYVPQDRAAPMTPAPMQDDGGIWVPIHSFCASLHVELKDIDGAGQLAVCDTAGGDVCVPLPATAVRSIAGETFARLQAFAEPLGLSWQVTANGVLRIQTGTAAATVGLRPGDAPPRIELPDVVSGQLVSSDVYHDRPAVFYMWASW